MAYEGEDSPHAPNGVEWWLLKTHIGKKQPFGAERRLAAYLWFNVEVGRHFTMRALRAELGDGVVPEDAEHLNRRLRELRKHDWIITSYKDDRTLPTDTYRLDGKGRRLWLGERSTKGNSSQTVRRQVLDRDGSRCTVCGVGDRESYPGEPGTKARLTVGHRVPRERGGLYEPDNLRTECSRCNEPMRHEAVDPESFDEVWAEIRTLKTVDLRLMLQWLHNGQRTRSKLDRAYDRVRKLSASEQQDVRDRLTNMLKDKRDGGA